MDSYLFRLINSEWTNPFFDWLLPLWRAKLTWVPLYIALGIFIVIIYQKKAFFIGLAIALTILVTDQISSQLIKKTVQRPRPCRALSVDKQEVRVLVDCGGGFSFPSSHAANHFALAAFLAALFGARYQRKWIPIALFGWAFSIGYGQIYVGVHYPSDVLAGSLLGLCLGWLMYKFFVRIMN